MNPLVEQMLNTTVSNDVETRLLEDLFEHEAKCESTHLNPENSYCSGNVTHLGISCTPAMKLCDSASQYWKESIDGTIWGRCVDCNQGTEKCWTIRPI